MNGNDWDDLAATWKAGPEPAIATLLAEIRRLQRRRRAFFALEIATTLSTLALIAHGWLTVSPTRVEVHRWLVFAAVFVVIGQYVHWRLRGRFGVFAQPAASLVGLLDQRLRAERYVIAHLGLSAVGCTVLLIAARLFVPSASASGLFLAAGLPTLAWLAYAWWRARRAVREKRRLKAERAALGDDASISATTR